MIIRELDTQDITMIWKINEEGLPGTGKVSEDEIEKLLNYSELSLGAFDENGLLGVVICLLPRTEYGSLNYAWFNKNYHDFLYVDRVAVTKNSRNQRIGSLLYEKVIAYAKELGFPIAAEVSLKPPNPDSIRFHKRHGFTEVGVLHHEEKSVTMMLRNIN